MRGVIFALSVAAFTAGSGPLFAADSLDTTAGQRLAEKWCAECHVPGAAARGHPGIAPSFRAVANDPATTERSVRVFLRSPHPTMPNVSLTREQVDDLVAYILSFKDQ
ncbi:MAG: cytochrome c [Alphaproteobacteria bacterium]